MNLPKLANHLTDLVDKSGPVCRQLQITAVSDPVKRGTKNRSSRFHPIILRLADGVSALGKDIREEIRKQPSFRIVHAFDIGDHPQRHAVAYETAQDPGLCERET